MPSPQLHHSAAPGCWFLSSGGLGIAQCVAGAARSLLGRSSAGKAPAEHIERG